MQLRAYLAILLRMWPVVALLPVLVGGLSLGSALGRPPTYQAAARLLITQAPLAGRTSAVPALDDGATWATTEYILDDLPFVFASAAFALDVQAALVVEGYQADAATLQAALTPEVTHRAVYLTATAGDPNEATAILRSAVVALQHGGLKYWGRASAGGLAVAVIDPPSTATPLGGPRALAREVGVRVALALVASIGLAFLANYLDDRLRSPQQAEQWIGARVLGVIPKE